MKKLVILFAIALINYNVKAGNDPYTEAMIQGMTMLASAQELEDYQAVANQFERIANTETEKWHPSYYASFAMIILAANQQDPAEIDKNLEIAQGFLDKANQLSENNAEILALQGFIHMLAIGVDPGTRGQEYSGLSAAALQKAQALDPDNPRVMHLLARLTYGTSMFFGADTSSACNMNDIAVQKFEAVEGIDSEDPFAPSWGKEMALGFQNECGN